MKTRMVLWIALAIIALLAVGCRPKPGPDVAAATSVPTSVPATKAKVIVTLDKAPPGNQLVVDTEYRLPITLDPPEAKVRVEGVVVTSDRGVNCVQSEVDDYIWYCKATEAVQNATIKISLAGTNVVADPVSIPVSVRAPDGPLPTATATPEGKSSPVSTATEAAGGQGAGSSSATAPAPTNPAKTATPPAPTRTPKPTAPPEANGCPPRGRDPIQVARPLAQFDNLAEGQSIPWDVEVSGKIDPAQMGGRKLWLLVWPLPLPDKPGYVPSLHPQSDIDAEGKFPATAVESDGSFFQLSRFGESWTKNVGECFDLLAVLVDDKGHEQFDRYLLAAFKRSDWPGIAPQDMPDMEIVGAAQNLIRE